MPILSMPSLTAFQATRFILRGNTVELVSPLTRTVQVLELLGTRWAASFELPPMRRADAETWIAFLTSLQGMAGRFYAGDPNGMTAQGVATGVPLVKTANQTGTSLLTDGWTPTVTGILKAGDYIAWNTPTTWREMHMLTADASSDGGGNATLSIAPPIRESPADNATIITASPTCVMRLATADEAAWDVSAALVYGIRFNAEEAFADSL